MSKHKPARSSSRARGRGEKGSVSIELVILMPALFALMFLGMQAALHYQARTVAIAAAQQGARAVGAEHGRESDGVHAADDFIVEAGGADVLTGTSTSASRTATRATVTVTGFSLSVIPGWKVRITQTASVPVEHLTAPIPQGSP
ncbi:TadE family protein [Nocardioides jishulii]|uniref:Pilus assembly protein n=1 Tax=Nocardioides jishulii TaxID=2575440 RepID=A0A4U2YMN0_9ACTN|nr:TadE family protein [Nocardioides jishulii]QCX27712.1 pilus assembly protein [Nocardioides jishulii]TKI62519.1 pilus assembly protein [Nocardioides jishulii]